MEFVSKLGYYKIPGGGIEKDETRIEACKRELYEETGCEIKITSELGSVEEYRSEFNFFQTSYCYLGKVVKKGTPHFGPGEIADGMTLVWLSLDDAIAKVKGSNTDDYESKFIQERDLKLLEEAKRTLS